MYELLILKLMIKVVTGPSWSWSYGSWIYNYLFAIRAYHHKRCEFELRSGEVYILR